MITKFEQKLTEKELYGKVPNWLINDILEVAEIAEKEIKEEAVKPLNEIFLRLEQLAIHKGCCGNSNAIGKIICDYTYNLKQNKIKD